MKSDFPSGRWGGFWTYPIEPTHHEMELDLKFEDGAVTGQGRDHVGEFTISGRYDDEGSCSWTKRYVGKHDVRYIGGRDSRGISGVWLTHSAWSGHFAIQHAP